MKENTRKLLNDLNLSNRNKSLLKDKIKEIKSHKWYILKFNIDGIPVQTARPRSGKFGNMYVPNASKNKKYIKQQIENQIDFKEVIQGEVILKVNFYMPMPKGFSKIDKMLAEMGYIKCTTKPDIDNLLKTVMDGISYANLWIDDNQVISVSVKKLYSINPRTEVILKYKQDISCSILRQYNKNKLTNFNNK